MKKLASLMFATGLLALAMACDTSDSTTSPDIAIEDPTGAWALQSFQLDDGSIIPVPEPSSYTLDLGTVDAERAHIRADCNVCNGGYEISGSTIEFGAMGCTLAACPPGSLERDFLLRARVDIDVPALWGYADADIRRRRAAIPGALSHPTLMHEGAGAWLAASGPILFVVVLSSAGGNDDCALDNLDLVRLPGGFVRRSSAAPASTGMAVTTCCPPIATRRGLCFWRKSSTPCSGARPISTSTCPSSKTI